jgi:hypothetical protein
MVSSAVFPIVRRILSRIDAGRLAAPAGTTLALITQTAI